MPLFNHADGQHLDVEGASIYFELRGNRNGKPLVLLHGGFGDMETFNALLPFMKADYLLIGIDSRGQGKSTLGDVPLTYARIQKDVEEVLKHLGITTASLIGHSDGGIVGLRLAAEGNITIEKLVTIGSHWHLAEDDPARALFAEVTAESWKAMFPESYNAYQRLNPKPDFCTLTDQILRLWLDTGPLGYPGEMIRDITGSLLVVRGDDDMLISRQQAVEIADMVVGACLLNVPFASHTIHEEKPELLMSCINEFLGK